MKTNTYLCNSNKETDEKNLIFSLSWYNVSTNQAETSKPWNGKS